MSAPQPSARALRTLTAIAVLYALLAVPAAFWAPWWVAVLYAVLALGLVLAVGCRGGGRR